MPNGNDTAASQAFRDYLYAAYLRDIQVPRIGVDWENLYWVAIFSFVLIGFFWLYTRHFGSVHRDRGELYGATLFGGAILERIGRVSRLNWICYLAFTLYSAFFIVEHIIGGQVY